MAKQKAEGATIPEETQQTLRSEEYRKQIEAASRKVIRLKERHFAEHRAYHDSYLAEHPDAPFVPQREKDERAAKAIQAAEDQRDQLAWPEVVNIAKARGYKVVFTDFRRFACCPPQCGRLCDSYIMRPIDASRNKGKGCRGIIAVAYTGRRFLELRDLAQALAIEELGRGADLDDVLKAADRIVESVGIPGHYYCN